ncbi:DUF3144 domain-containing protein [Pseudoduganella violaceinigra]|uniref:DUF3144 domain-containing protein n=1 Tax=Pseudoduganella violaceinigra TaxID=246602 RepID=UPI0004253A65|nr:DUF3144 domain-containing protein [Pseudoduganella violaceinigra]
MSEQATQQQQQNDNQKFFENVDAYIALANAHENSNVGAPQLVGASLLFAAARYNAYLVARAQPDLETFKGKKEEAKAYFIDQFNKMFDDNWAEYTEQFTKK